MEVQEGLCSNISIGGMMVHSDHPRPQGSLVRFELVIDDDVTIRGLGEVIWMRTQASSSSQERGMGIKFRFLEQRDRQLIFKLVSQHIKERLAQKHPGEESDDEAAPSPPPADTPAIPPASTPPAPTPPSKAPPAPRSSESYFDPLDDSLESPDDFGSERPAAEPGGIFGTPREDGLAGGPDDETFSDERYDDEPFDSPRLDETSEELYRPRPARRRGFPVLPAVALLVVVGIVVLYLYWNEIFGPPPPPPAVAEPPTVAEPAAAEPKVNVRKIEPGERVAEPDTGMAEPASAPPANAPPPAARPAPPPPRPAPPPPPSSPPPIVASFDEVLDITWTRQPGGLKVIVETDGTISSGRYRHFRLDGDNPREVLRLNGVKSRFPKSEIPISGAAVSRIRIGYHDNRELHIVLDMRDRTSKVGRVRTEGRRIELYIE